ncbi:hypothetical protein [Frondihabitans sp. VKM Ac-2883]|uniref:hypothetical protein n=1 Tax=Frondihabitans sp. VKM Ac-2883 TaxID=2783823 RepID=UPI00188A42EC|nr:hypothetical protein [Frondihabitans sp. VKM Ac-2883]MBF4577587.1 hypothetical protein [Frondihabitans sp. VKM Ac-2883]
MATTENALADTLTALVEATPGVTRLYPPIRAVPGANAARQVLTDLKVLVPAARVVVDHGRKAVFASIGIGLSAPAGDIGADVCSRIEQCLASAGREMDVKITIAYVTN